MSRQCPGGTFRTAAIVILALGLLPALASAQVVVKVNDNVNFRFGLQLQGWADWTQDPNSEGYSQNMFLRRIRFILAANVAPGVSIFYQTDNPRAGNAGADGAKIINTGFLTQDAFVEWKIAGDALMLDGGLYLVPTSRNGLTSTQSFQAFDIGTWALQSNTLEKGNGGRDYGFGLKGYLVGDHLEYRAAVFSGNRFGTTPQTAPLGPAAGSRNSFRAAGRIQYDFFDVEKGYVYAGTFRGTKKIVAVGTWGDTQGDFRAFGGDFVVDWPIGKDAIKAEVDYDHFDGGRAFAATLPEQNDVYADVGYYFDVIKVQPFGVYQSLNFTSDATKGRDQERYGGGLNWYIYGQNLKLSVLWERIVPKTKPATAKIKDTNHIAVQLQAVYF